ncbi:hypothetical protein WJX72_000371 [[Myrmecia] bisecta]|uniref:Uncharacterized protein n=1 Tax=[Myrmecia] bisecta TaxID=41462 RepID=A0AAW1PLZ2_9CHLO
MSELDADTDGLKERLVKLGGLNKPLSEAGHRDSQAEQDDSSRESKSSGHRHSQAKPQGQREQRHRYARQEVADSEPAPVPDAAALYSSLEELKGLLRRLPDWQALLSTLPDVPTKLARRRRMKPPRKSRKLWSPPGVAHLESRHEPALRHLHLGGPPHSPLALMLARLRDAEERWLTEKAELRREAESQRKRAHKAELELQQLKGLYKHRGTEMKAVMAALRRRDEELAEHAGRLTAAHEALDQGHGELEKERAGLAEERDELHRLLAAALDRLEVVDTEVTRVKTEREKLQKQVGEAEAERKRAQKAAALAKSQLASQADEQMKAELQSSLLEKLLDVQLKHNQKKANAIRNMLGSDKGMQHLLAMSTVESDGGSGSEPEKHSSKSRHGAATSRQEKDSRAEKSRRSRHERESDSEERSGRLHRASPPRHEKGSRGDESRRNRHERDSDSEERSGSSHHASPSRQDKNSQAEKPRRSRHEREPSRAEATPAKMPETSMDWFEDADMPPTLRHILATARRH